MQPKEPPETKGVTVADVLSVFRGAKVITENAPLFCRACDRHLIPEYSRIEATATTKELVTLLAKRRGKIIERAWSDGRREWACHYCGRAVQVETETGAIKKGR